MEPTPHFMLANAAAACRANSVGRAFSVRGQLTPAQLGAVVRLQHAAEVETDSDAGDRLRAARVIQSAFSPGSEAQSQATKGIETLAGLENTLGAWLDTASEWESRVKIGYWLTSVFVRGVRPDEALLLTSLLMVGSRAPQRDVHRSVRRYPSGGISEKQALILPALLRLVAREANLCSPFLVARRLAHTGGTFDKLSVLPGIAFGSVADFNSWNPVRVPVRYFTAGEDLCPRDAVLYRLRGETGTVPDFGLMASSIMSKQLALPVSVLILDVLFGRTAFLQSRGQADEFSSLCSHIGSAWGSTVLALIRGAEAPLGNCIGNVTELLEAVELLGAPNIAIEPLRGEMELSIRFLHVFLEQLGSDVARVMAVVEQGTSSGALLDALLELWCEHGVPLDFLSRIKQDPESTFLADLEEHTILVSRPGVVKTVDYVALADVANNVLNAYVNGSGHSIRRIRKGGIRLFVSQGDVVRSGSPSMKVYFEEPLPKAVLDRLGDCVAIGADT